jgi:hypothetical protein
LAVVAWRLLAAFLSQVLDRGAQAVARGVVSCALQVLGRGAKAVASGAARCASHVLERCAQASAQTTACGDTTLPHQGKNIRHMSGWAEFPLQQSKVFFCFTLVCCVLCDLCQLVLVLDYCKSRGVAGVKAAFTV